MVFLRFLFPMSFQKPIQKLGMDVCEVWQLKFWRKIQKWKICSKMTFCMNVSRFMNLAAIFSLDLESQSKYQQKFWQKVEILSAAASAVSATQNRIAELYPQLSAILFLQFLQVQLWQLFFWCWKCWYICIGCWWLYWCHSCEGDFTDVTLVCEDSQRFEAHKVILAASFETLLVSALLLLLSAFFLQICCWKLLKHQLTYLH